MVKSWGSLTKLQSDGVQDQKLETQPMEAGCLSFHVLCGHVFPDLFMWDCLGIYCWGKTQ